MCVNIDVKYKSIPHRYYASLRNNKAPELTVDQAALGPLSYDTRPPKSDIHISTPVVRGKVIKATGPPVLNSSVGSLGGQAVPLEISLSLGGGAEAKLQLDEKSVAALSGWRATTILEKPTLGKAIDLSQFSSGYRILEQCIGYTNYITIIPSG